LKEEKEKEKIGKNTTLHVYQRDNTSASDEHSRDIPIEESKNRKGCRCIGRIEGCVKTTERGTQLVKGTYKRLKRDLMYRNVAVFTECHLQV
jgi:hypothetical protein